MQVIRVSLLASFVCVTLGSSWHDFIDFSHLSPGKRHTGSELGPNLGKSKDSREFEFYRHYIQQHTIKENDQRKDYVRYYSRKPAASEKHINENDSFDSTNSRDSSEEKLKWIRKKLDSDHNRKYSHKHDNLKFHSSESDISRTDEKYRSSDKFLEDSKEKRPHLYRKNKNTDSNDSSDSLHASERSKEYKNSESIENQSTDEDRDKSDESKEKDVNFNSQELSDKVKLRTKNISHSRKHEKFNSAENRSKRGDHSSDILKLIEDDTSEESRKNSQILENENESQSNNDEWSRNQKDDSNSLDLSNRSVLKNKSENVIIEGRNKVKYLNKQEKVRSIDDQSTQEDDDLSDILKSKQDESSENSQKDSRSIDLNERYRGFGSNTIKNENEKIRNLLNELNKTAEVKRSTTRRNIHDLDIQRILQESIIKQWKEMEIAVQLILIDNYRYARKLFLQEMLNNEYANRRQISRLQRKISLLYFISKKDINQTVRSTKTKFRIDVSKSNLSKEKIYEAEQLYISKLKEQIDNKINVFKQNVDFAIDQFRLELKPVIDYTTTQQTITNKPTTEVPFDPVYESAATTSHVTIENPTTSTAGAGHVSIENLPTDSLTEVDDTFDSANSTNTVSGQGSHRVLTSRSQKNAGPGVETAKSDDIYNSTQNNTVIPTHQATGSTEFVIQGIKNPSTIIINKNNQEHKNTQTVTRETSSISSITPSEHIQEQKPIKDEQNNTTPQDNNQYILTSSIIDTTLNSQNITEPTHETNVHSVTTNAYAQEFITTNEKSHIPNYHNSYTSTISTINTLKNYLKKTGVTSEVEEIKKYTSTETTHSPDVTIYRLLNGTLSGQNKETTAQVSINEIFQSSNQQQDAYTSYTEPGSGSIPNYYKDISTDFTSETITKEPESTVTSHNPHISYESSETIPVTLNIDLITKAETVATINQNIQNLNLTGDDKNIIISSRQRQHKSTSPATSTTGTVLHTELNLRQPSDTTLPEQNTEKIIEEVTAASTEQKPTVVIRNSNAATRPVSEATWNDHNKEIESEQSYINKNTTNDQNNTTFNHENQNNSVTVETTRTPYVNTQKSLETTSPIYNTELTTEGTIPSTTTTLNLHDQEYTFTIPVSETTINNNADTTILQGLTEEIKENLNNVSPITTNEYFVTKEVGNSTVLSFHQGNKSTTPVKNTTINKLATTETTYTIRTTSHQSLQSISYNLDMKSIIPDTTTLSAITVNKYSNESTTIENERNYTTHNYYHDADVTIPTDATISDNESTSILNNSDINTFSLSDVENITTSLHPRESAVTIKIDERTFSKQDRDNSSIIPVTDTTGNNHISTETTNIYIATLLPLNATVDSNNINVTTQQTTLAPPTSSNIDNSDNRSTVTEQNSSISDRVTISITIIDADESTPIANDSLVSTDTRSEATTRSDNITETSSASPIITNSLNNEHITTMQKENNTFINERNDLYSVSSHAAKTTVNDQVSTKSTNNAQTIAYLPTDATIITTITVDDKNDRSGITTVTEKDSNVTSLYAENEIIQKNVINNSEDETITTSANNINVTNSKQKELSTEESLQTTTAQSNVNADECVDNNGITIDCGSIIKTTTINLVNSDSTRIINQQEQNSNTLASEIWPGIPPDCLPLFLASDGTVLNSVPSDNNGITDPETLNLCLSIAQTIIQLNKYHKN